MATRKVFATCDFLIPGVGWIGTGDEVTEPIALDHPLIGRFTTSKSGRKATNTDADPAEAQPPTPETEGA